MGRPVNIGRAPVFDPVKGNLGYQVARQDHTRVFPGGVRVGYYGYDRYWRDSYFTFGFYCFDPYAAPVVISPWWYYPCLPAYISPDRCFYRTYVDLPPVFVGAEYNWSGGYDNGYNDGYQAGRNDAERDNRSIDNTVDDIVSVFEKDDMSALDRLVPRNGDVNIYMDGRYSYSLHADDFYNLMKDNAETVRTVRYDILDVRTQRDEVRVIARHTFEDPWGRRTSVYHSYRIRLTGGGGVITEYGTSDTQP